MVNIYYDIFDSYKNKFGPMLKGMPTGIDPLKQVDPYREDLEDPEVVKNRVIKTMGMALGGIVPSLDDGGVVTQGGIAQVATGEMFSMDGFSGLKEIVSEFERLLSDAKIEIKDTKVKLETDTVELNADDAISNIESALSDITLSVDREPLSVEEISIDATDAVTAIETAIASITIDVNRDPLPVEDVMLRVDDTPIRLDTTALEGIVLEVNRDPIPIDTTTIEIGEVTVDTASITTAITSALSNTPLAVGGESEAARSLATIVEDIKDKVIDLVDWQSSTDAIMITQDNISEFVDSKIKDAESFMYAEMNRTILSRQDEIRLNFQSTINNLQFRIERAEEEINRTKSLAMSQNLGTV
jgi:hypothetical protein